MNLMNQKMRTRTQLFIHKSLTVYFYLIQCVKNIDTILLKINFYILIIFLAAICKIVMLLQCSCKDTVP